jgi:inner membrane protein
LSLTDALPAASCPSHRLTRWAPASGQLVWQDAPRADLRRLRALESADCWTRGWMQFGRAPYLAGNDLVDLRFDRGGDNFTRMPVAAAGRDCPRGLTAWRPPRVDVLP